MSDTPETNSAEERCIATGFKTGYVHVEFALKLERERDHWRECAEGLAAALKQMRDIPDYAEFALTQFEKLKENQ